MICGVQERGEGEGEDRRESEREREITVSIVRRYVGSAPLARIRDNHMFAMHII